MTGRCVPRAYYERMPKPIDSKSNRTSLPVLAAPPAAGRSISISTTSPSIISVSSLIRTPMAFRKAWSTGGKRELSYISPESQGAGAGAAK